MLGYTDRIVGFLQDYIPAVWEVRRERPGYDQHEMRAQMGPFLIFLILIFWRPSQFFDIYLGQPRV